MEIEVLHVEGPEWKPHCGSPPPRAHVGPVTTAPLGDSPVPPLQAGLWAGSGRSGAPSFASLHNGPCSHCLGFKTAPVFLHLLCIFNTKAATPGMWAPPPSRQEEKFLSQFGGLPLFSGVPRQGCPFQTLTLLPTSYLNPTSSPVSPRHVVSYCHLERRSTCICFKVLTDCIYALTRICNLHLL